MVVDGDNDLGKDAIQVQDSLFAEQQTRGSEEFTLLS
jgi:hypothetical protein